jgi:hypothetical protein
MCGACGILGGGPEWMDRVNNPDGIGHDDNLTFVAERERRIRFVNLLLQADGSRITNFGSMTIVRGATGRTEVVESLMHVWSAADRVGSRPADPLDPSLLLRLRGSGPDARL